MWKQFALAGAVAAFVDDPRMVVGGGRAGRQGQEYDGDGKRVSTRTRWDLPFRMENSSR